MTLHSAFKHIVETLTSEDQDIPYPVTTWPRWLPVRTGDRYLRYPRRNRSMDVLLPDLQHATGISMTGTEIKRAREESELTQEQVAWLLGVHPMTVSKWERSILHLSQHQTVILKTIFGYCKHPGPRSRLQRSIDSNDLVSAIRFALGSTGHVELPTAPRKG